VKNNKKTQCGFFSLGHVKKKKKKRLKAGKLPRQTRNNNVIGLQDKEKKQSG